MWPRASPRSPSPRTLRCTSSPVNSQRELSAKEFSCADLQRSHRLLERLVHEDASVPRHDGDSQTDATGDYQTENAAGVLARYAPGRAEEISPLEWRPADREHWAGNQVAWRAPLASGSVPVAWRDRSTRSGARTNTP